MIVLNDTIGKPGPTEEKKAIAAEHNLCSACLWYGVECKDKSLLKLKPQNEKYTCESWMYYD